MSVNLGASWGLLREGTPFATAFPDRRVPLRSPWPMQPRDADAPSCYLVAGELLSDDQVATLARQLHELWAPECSGLEEAATYIRNGLPLRTSWFLTVSTTRLGLLYLP